MMFHFVATADYYGNKVFEEITSVVPPNPTRYDLADCLKKLMREIDNNRWMLSWRNDLEQFLRKLPSEFWEQNRKKDIIDYQRIMKMFHFSPKVSMDEVVAVVSTLAASLYFPEMIGEKRSKAMDLLIDGVIEKL